MDVVMEVEGRPLLRRYKAPWKTWEKILIPLALSAAIIAGVIELITGTPI